MEKLKVAVVLPAYNAAQDIADILEAWHNFLRSLNRPFEIVLVDDGSRDDTVAIMLGNGHKGMGRYARGTGSR